MDRIETLRIDARAADGQVVAARLHRGAEPSRLVLVAGAYAVPRRFYDRFAGYLAEKGLAAVTVDYRHLGESRSGSLRGVEARATDWIRDLDAAVSAAREHHPDLPLSVAAHSFGGQVTPLLDCAGQVESMVTVGTMFAHPRHWSGVDRLRMELVFRVAIPGLSRALGYLPGWSGIGEDVPPHIARDWARWCRSRDYLLDHVDGARERYAAFDVPVHAWAVTDDTYAPLPGVQAFAGHLPRATVRTLSPDEIGLTRLGHFGPLRPAARTLWDWILDDLEPGRRQVA